MKIFKIIFFIISIQFLLYSEKDINEIFKLANEKYKKGNYNEAIELYESIIKKGVKNGYIFYNLGNAYFKNNQLGKAILNYERAKLFLPYDKDVNFNLKFANNLTKDKFTEKEISPFIKILLFFYNLFDINSLTLILYFLFLLIIAHFFVKWFVKNTFIRELNYKVIKFLLSIFLILLFILIIKIYSNENISYGIVTASETQIRSGPGEEYTVIFVLHEGTKLMLHNKSGDHIQVTLPNDYSGWIKLKDIEKI
jgi:tetratricopeptide (TPR) repeat protein